MSFQNWKNKEESQNYQNSASAENFEMLVGK